MQEVDRYNDLANLLQKDGFVGVYKVLFWFLMVNFNISVWFLVKLLFWSFRDAQEKQVMDVLYSGKRKSKFLVTLQENYVLKGV